MKRRITTRELAEVAMGAALLTVCAWLSIPAAVPFTMQTFAVLLIAALFGARLGTLTVLCYLLLGAVGAPVFSGFKGGLGALLGTTGGYLAGFLLTGVCVGWASERFGRSSGMLIGAMALGVALCYAFGTAWFVVVYAKGSGPVGVGTALAWCVLPYLIPDALKIALAAFLTARLYPILRKE